MATQDNYIRTALRVPPELHAKIHESAKDNNRTFNAEIVARLEQSFSETTNTSHVRPRILDLAVKLRELQSQKEAISNLLEDGKNRNIDSKNLRYIAAELLGIEWDIDRVETLITELFISDDESPEILAKIKGLVEQSPTDQTPKTSK